MAQSPQRPRQPVPRSVPPPLRTEEDDYPPPAVQENRIITSGGGTLPLAPGEETEMYPPPEPVWTIADEQRERSDYIQSIGVEAYKAEVDNRTEEEKASLQPQIEGAQYPSER